MEIVKKETINSGGIYLFVKPQIHFYLYKDRKFVVNNKVYRIYQSEDEEIDNEKLKLTLLNEIVAAVKADEGFIIEPDCFIMKNNILEMRIE